MGRRAQQNPTVDHDVFPTGATTTSQQWRRPKGIHYEYNRQRAAAPFVLRWVHAGASRAQSFATEAERETAARALADKRDQYGSEILNFDPREWQRWLEFKSLIGDMDPIEMYHEWKRQGGGNQTGGSVKVEDAV